MGRENRNTIFVEDARVLSHEAFPDKQFILRVHAPRCAAAAKPGSFAHLQCATDIPMRRPLSIMRVNAEEGWVEFLYKIVGIGLERLSHLQPGEEFSLLGPIGNGFSTSPERKNRVLIGGGVGIPPMTFLAEQLLADGEPAPTVFMGSESPFPFELEPASVELPGIPDSATAAMPLMNEWGVPSRLASLSDFNGVYQGYVTDLAAAWLKTLDADTLSATELYACGPEPMLVAAAKVAAEFGVECQLCLEEYMACAVGGCAGCAVEILTPEGPAMKRVCVDGPVFSAASVYPELAASA